MTEDPILKLRLKSRLNSRVSGFLAVVVVASATRLYQLGSFPFFPKSWPWLGDNPLFPGLYRDEAARVADILKFPSSFPSYEPSIQIPLEKVAVIIFGQSNFAYRLPDALASILTAVVVYFAAEELFKRKDAALVSGLYYAVMVPAVIYGRMVIYENFVALFLAFTILCIAKYETGGKSRWLYLGAVSAAFAVLSQEAGLFVLIFFTLWAVARQGWKSKVLSLVLSWGPVVAGGAAVLVLVGSVHGVLAQWSFAQVGRELSLQFLFLQSMPSGNVIFNQGYVKPEFWYVFAYLLLAILVAANSRLGRLSVELIAAFTGTAVLFYGQGTGSYYAIMLYPVMALGVGGGLIYLAKGGYSVAIGFYSVLYAPLVQSYIASVALPFIGTNYALYTLQLAVFLAPVGLWLCLDAVSKSTVKLRFPLIVVMVVAFLGLLVLATPQLYSYFFLGKTP